MAALKSPLFHVVLVEPEIPNNTGNIGRTCVALGSALHLVHPLGFEVSAKACRRAGLDYWPRLDVREHANWRAYEEAYPGARRWYFTTGGGRSVFEARLERGDHLIFGKETAGLPRALLEANGERAVGLPMVPGERSLNVATAVCAAMYEGVRQMLAAGSVRLDEAGRLRSC